MSIPRVALGLTLLAAGCAWREPGLEVDVTLEVASSDAATYQTATLAVEEVRLVACGEARSPWRWLRALSPWGVAWAHEGDAGAAGPLASTSPVLVDLQRPGPQPLATLRPPPGTFCALALTFAPSTAQARSRGTTLLLEREGLLQLATVRRQAQVTLPSLRVDEAHALGSVQLHTGFAGPGDGGVATVEALVAGLH